MPYSEKARRFIAREASSRDIIDFKRVYARIGGDATVGLLLSQIVYYYLPWPGTNTPKIPDSEDGRQWLCFEREYAMGECCLSVKQFIRASGILEAKGIIEKRAMSRRESFRRSTFLCLDIDLLADMVDAEEQAMYEEHQPRVDLSVMPVLPRSVPFGLSGPSQRDVPVDPKGTFRSVPNGHPGPSLSGIPSSCKSPEGYLESGEPNRAHKCANLPDPEPTPEEVAAAIAELRARLHREPRPDTRAGRALVLEEVARRRMSGMSDSQT